MMRRRRLELAGLILGLFLLGAYCVYGILAGFGSTAGIAP